MRQQTSNAGVLRRPVQAAQARQEAARQKRVVRARCKDGNLLGVRPEPGRGQDRVETQLKTRCCHLNFLNLLPLSVSVDRQSSIAV